jgi:hypothetical protein
MLDLSVLSARVCGDEIHVAGTHAENALRWVMSINAAGEIVWQGPLPPPTDELVWISSVCVSGEPQIVWEVERDDGADLSIGEIHEGSIELLARFAQEENAYGMHVVTIGDRVFVLRSRGSEIGGDLLCFEGATLTARATTLKNAHAIAAVGNRLVVLAWTTSALLLHWLDASLEPLTEAETIVTAEAASSIRFATLHAVDEERIAVSYLVSYSDDLARHFLGRYDAGSQRLVDVVELIPAGTAWLTAAWIRDRLLFIHGMVGAALSIFELTPHANVHTFE